jgi:hypothetical protein
MKNKVLLFSAGILIGIALGVVFSVGIKALLSQVREFHLSLKRIDVRQSEMARRLDSLQGKMNESGKNQGKAQGITSSGTSKQRTAEPLKNVQPANNTTPKDTANQQNSDQNVVIMTNEFIKAASLPIINEDSVKENPSARKEDSTLAVMSQVKVEKEPSKFRIEFWHSPLNFKGYKMSDGKIILFGINSNTYLKLIKGKEALYLVDSPAVYRLEYTEDFKPFDKVNNSDAQKYLRL